MGLEISPQRQKRINKRRLRQEKSWANKNSPVTTRKATPEELANLKGEPPVKSSKLTPKRGELSM